MAAEKQLYDKIVQILSCLLLGFYNFILCILSILPTCTYVHHICAWWLQRSEEVLDPLGQELQKLMSRHVGAGSQTWIFCKKQKAFSYPLSHFTSPL